MHYKTSTINFYPSASLDEILTFIYFINWFEINSNKKTQYISFWEWFEFKSENDLKLFEIFLKLHLEWVINLTLREIWNDNQIINKELKEELKYHIQEDFRDKISKMLFRLGNEYDLHSIFYNWEEISKLIKKHDWFDISIEINWYSFLYLFFRKITEYKWYEKINKRNIINELFEIISKKINHEINLNKEIEIFFELDDYLENKILVLPLLKELEENKNIKINKIIIKDDYIYFYLDKFTNFKKEVIFEVAENINKSKILVDYKDNKIFINNEEIFFQKDKNWIYKESKIYNLYKIIFDSFDYHKTNKVTYQEIQLVFDLKKYNEIKKEYFIWDNYDKYIRKDLQEKNKNILEKFDLDTFIGIDKRWIWCEYYKPEKD